MAVVLGVPVVLAMAALGILGLRKLGHGRRARLTEGDNFAADFKGARGTVDPDVKLGF